MTSQRLAHRKMVTANSESQGSTFFGKLNGKVGVVTGASKGIGTAVVVNH